MEQVLDLHQAKTLFLLRCDSGATREAYEREIGRFLDWLPRAEVGCCERYVEHMRRRGLSPTTIRWRSTVSAAFLRSAHEQGILPEDVTTGFRAPKGTAGFAPRILSDRELKRLLDAPDRRSHKGKRDLAILVCLGIGGLRAGEVCRLTVGDVRFEPSRAILRVTGKGKKLRLVPFTGQAAIALRAYKRAMRMGAGDGEPFFLSFRKPPRRLSVPCIDYILRRVCESAALPSINAHALRHTAASRAIESGTPLHRVRDLLGHGSILVTGRYLHVGEKVGMDTSSAHVI